MIKLFIINSILVIMTVAIHYEFLYRLNQLIPKLPVVPRSRVIFAVIGALIAHTIEVWLFAFAYYFMHHAEGFGSLGGNFEGTLMDCVYFSFSTYTTLGFGDIMPAGGLRFLTGIESLTGFVLITWTASFIFIEMQKYWNNHFES